MSDETLIDRVARRVERNRYDGPERRERPSEWLKWLPLAAVAVTAAMGYGALQQRVSALEKFTDKADAQHQAIWRRIVE